MVNILNNPNISKFHRTNSEGHYKGVFLFGRRPDRVIEMACFDSKLQKARNTSERKQAKRRECLPRDVSRYSIYLRYIRRTDNARQTNRQ